MWFQPNFSSICEDARRPENDPSNRLSEGNGVIFMERMSLLLVAMGCCLWVVVWLLWGFDSRWMWQCYDFDVASKMVFFLTFIQELYRWWVSTPLFPPIYAVVQKGLLGFSFYVWAQWKKWNVWECIHFFVEVFFSFSIFFSSASICMALSSRLSL